MILPVTLFLSLFLVLRIGIAPEVDTKTLLMVTLFPILIFRKSITPKELGETSRFVTLSRVLFGAMVIYILGSAYVTPYKYFVVKNLGWWWSGILGFLLVYRYHSDERGVESFLKLFVLFMSFSSIYVLAQYFGYIPDPLLRAFPVEVTGHLGHKSTFSILAAIAIVTAVHLLQTPNPRKILVAELILIGFALLLADSRVPLAMSVVAVVIYLIPRIIETRAYQLPKFWMAVVGISVMVVTIPVLFWGNGITSRFAMLVNGSSDTFRLATWESAIAMIKSSPLLGHGFGSFPELVYPHYPQWYTATFAHSNLPWSAHCEYLQRLAEIGVVGSGFYFFFWIAALLFAVIILKKRWDSLHFLFLIALAMLMVDAGYQEAALKVPVSTALWMLIGWFWAKRHPEAFAVITIKQSRRTLSSTGIIALLTSVLVFWNVGKLQLADYYYLKGVNYKTVTTSPYKTREYMTALKLFPQHIFAAYNVLDDGHARGQTDPILAGCDQVEKFSPYYQPLYSLKGYIYLEKNMPDSALVAVNRGLVLHGKNFQETIVKVRALQLLGRCAEMDSVVNSIDTTGFDNWKKPQTPKEMEAYDTHFFELIGKGRTVLGGPWLRASYETYAQEQANQYTGMKAAVKMLKGLECPPKP